MQAEMGCWYAQKTGPKKEIKIVKADAKRLDFSVERLNSGLFSVWIMLHGERQGDLTKRAKFRYSAL